ncbi:hypothetical protein U9M48_025783 [Paspalum notatum var. saurae]|uniref:Uncharacterized protein n=1 Tax=Paspalum notatum var. saurae TaxID=547442 RepID=A0AAQ3TVQ4_PASNO
MGFQEVKKMLQYQDRRHAANEVRVEDHRQDGTKIWVLGLAGIALPVPLQQLKPVKTGGGRRRDAAAVEEGGEAGGDSEEPVTPTGEGCRIPAEAATCPPAPKKPRTAVSIVRGSSAAGRRCNCDGEALVDEFFRVPADLEAVFVSCAAKAN